MIPYSVCASFIFAALPSVIQTVTFLRAAGSIHRAQRLQWKPRGPVVKETLSSNIGICTHAYTCSHTHRQGHMNTNWQIQEEVGSHTLQMVSQMFFLKCSVTQIKDWLFGQMFLCAFSSIFSPAIAEGSSCSHSFFPPLLFFPPACLSQEASQRHTPLCATIMASAARRKCSG